MGQSPLPQGRRLPDSAEMSSVAEYRDRAAKDLRTQKEVSETALARLYFIK